MNAQLKKKLISLADKYENSDFLKADPSQFMHRYSSVRDKEVVAFIASSLAFGNRKQILSHIQLILDDVDKAGGKKNSSPAEYILNEKYKLFFKPAKETAVCKKDEMNCSFYRVFTFENMCAMFNVLREIFLQEKTLGAFFKKKYLASKTAAIGKENISSQNAASAEEIPLYEIVRAPFANRGCGNLIPYTKNSACKRIQLFLRWMVRTNSPVDEGIWTWYDKANLLIPLDVHVVQESVALGLLQKTQSGKLPAASITMAKELTAQLKQVWPEDPLKGDYALFGSGVN